MEPEMQPVVVKTFVGATQTIAAEQFAADARADQERAEASARANQERAASNAQADRERAQAVAAPLRPPAGRAGLMAVR